MLSLPTRSILRNTSLARAMSTRARPQGLSGILQKNPDDVVITFGKRTAVGRAKKGQWKDTTVDELLRALFKVCLGFLGCQMSSLTIPHQATLEKTKLDPSKLDDICVGK